MTENKELITQERTQLLNNFRNSLDAIVQKASQDKTPITEEEPQLEKFCSTMEGILQFGFKHENKDVPLLEDVWNFISTTLEKNSLEDIDNGEQGVTNSNDSINMKKQEITRNMLSIVDYVSNYVKEENEIISSVKIWIQASLVHQVFSLQWQILMNNIKAIQDNYHEWAIMRTLDDSILISGFLNVFDTIMFNINIIPFEILEGESIPQKLYDTMGNLRETINNTLQRTSVHLQKIQQNINDRNVQSLKDKLAKSEKEIAQLQEEKQKMQQEINALHLTLEAERRLRQHLEHELESIHQKVKNNNNNNNINNNNNNNTSIEESK
ncbi:hypothetical protein BCR32DRAFT_295290 [Anaeromyces robustus]|uniref:RUN domain-containing protein n=1 Tax=Anaeromyces robustus TaxID=1754192 RepID=A0A1Y1WWS2_9FUNG|nr:hypothetical protein BCR32DRAFT_295290 [Anaeromyces robustus]|eukprot:ORX77953.1 hypothetical protein BCR32DRAFT_295290 [Anaeromyces robustus]